MKRRILLTATVAGAATLALPALAAETLPARAQRKSTRPTVRTSIGRIRDAGVLKVGLVRQFPWASQGDDAKWVGFEVDVGNRVASDLGVRAEFIESHWDQAADDVAQQVVDVVGGLWPTPRRALVVNFSHAYATSRTTLVASRQKAAGLGSVDAFDRPEVVIGVRADSEGERVARGMLGKSQLRTLKDDAEGLVALESGDLFALVVSTPLAEILEARAADKFVLPLAAPLRRRSEAFAVRVDEFDLLSYLNAWITFNDEIGWLADRRRYWFGGAGTG